MVPSRDYKISAYRAAVRHLAGTYTALRPPPPRRGDIPNTSSQLQRGDEGVLPPEVFADCRQKEVPSCSSVH